MPYIPYEDRDKVNPDMKPVVLTIKSEAHKQSLINMYDYRNIPYTFVKSEDYSDDDAITVPSEPVIKTQNAPTIETKSNVDAEDTEVIEEPIEDDEVIEEVVEDDEVIEDAEDNEPETPDIPEDRVCPHCGTKARTDSSYLKNHGENCARNI